MEQQNNHLCEPLLDSKRVGKLNDIETSSVVIYADGSDEAFHTKIIGSSSEGPDDNAEEGGTTSVSSMLIIIANNMGIGALGLAHAFSKVGWMYVV